LGYMAAAEAFDEGGYEVDWAMVFYNVPRLKRGGLEAVATRARELLLTGEAPHNEGRHD